MSRTTIHLDAALIAALVAAGCGGNDKAADTPTTGAAGSRAAATA
jgi:hypothetical protein